ncbi:MAG: hypothetical protein KDD69_16685, partial [Bdellovibrionales bacterium]|nr:hypothetical protein [Bdellovibrionales bacterium]
TQLDRMVSNELSRVAERLRQIESRLASLRRIDPIAVFTLPEQPHLLRFIGHWDVINGKPELHM